jgi:uncharacterized phage protein (TIGR02216 family)
MSRNESGARPFPWDEAMGFGLGILRLSPEDFWRMTPRELACAMRAVRGQIAPALGRAEFAELLKRYPDGRKAKMR